RINPDVVLEVDVVHPLIKMNIDEVVQLEGIACAEKEIRKRNSLLGSCVGRAERVGLSGRHKAESAVIRVLTIGRVEVIDRGVNCLIFVSQLVRVTSPNQRVIDLRVEDVGILILRIAALIAELRETRNARHLEAAYNSRSG